MSTSEVAKDISSGISSIVNIIIKSNLKEIESCIKTLEQAENEYNEIVNRIDSLRIRLESAWEGQTATKYLDKLTKEEKQIADMNQLVGQVKQLAIARKNSLENYPIWEQEINNSTERIGKPFNSLSSL